MEYINFKGLKFFRPSDTTDNWGNPKRLSSMALQKLDQLRDILGQPVHVTSAYRKGNGTSQHHYGKAFDIIVPGIELIDVVIAAERVGLLGIGIYPHWQYRGDLIGGVHVDDRGTYARWLGVKGSNGKQEYITYNYDNLKTYGVI